MQTWLLCLVGSLTLVVCEVQINWKPKPKICAKFEDEDLFCNKTLFMETFVKDSACIDTSALEEYVVSQRWESSCKKTIDACYMHGDYQLRQNFVTLETGQVQVNFYTPKIPSECWGYYYEYTYGDNRKFAYINFEDKESMPVQKFTFKPHAKIGVRVVSIPGFFNLPETYTALDECGVNTLPLAKKAVLGCLAKASDVLIGDIHKWAEDACKYYPNLDQRKEIFTEMEMKCSKYIPVPEIAKLFQKHSTTPRTPMHIHNHSWEICSFGHLNKLLYGVIAVVVLIALVLGACFFMSRKRSKSKKLMETEYAGEKLAYCS